MHTKLKKMRCENWKKPDWIKAEKVKKNYQTLIPVVAFFPEFLSLRVTSKKSVDFDPSDITNSELDPRYFFGLFPVSLDSLAESKACSGCLAVSYKGKDEQKKDWKRHKALCKALQPLGMTKKI